MPNLSAKFPQWAQAELEQQVRAHRQRLHDLGNKWLTTEEICAITKFTKQTIISYVDKGLLVAYQEPGSNHWRFLAADVDKLFVPV
jgi:excisionase family DNA binding protein